MLIQVNSNHSIEGSEALHQHVRSVIEDDIAIFASQVTRVEVHLNDTNAAKGGADDKYCQIEARPAGLHPISVKCEASTLSEAIDRASTKLKHALEHTLGKHDRR